MSMELTLPSSFNVPNNLADRYGNLTENLGDGITSGYGIIGYKGKVWSIRYGSHEQILMREDESSPVFWIEVVIVKAASVVSRTYYENGYQEGSNSPPDCSSSNGIVPDSNAPNKQAVSCAVCPRNVLKVMPNGKPGKECANAKRLAVVPLHDLTNEAYGGPMLLRVPGGSLVNLKTFGESMKKYGFPLYWTYGTKISFDPGESFPKFVFSPVRPLTNPELNIVDEFRANSNTQRIIAESDNSETTGEPEWEAQKPQIQKPQTQPMRTMTPTTGAASSRNAQDAGTNLPAPTNNTAQDTQDRSEKSRSGGFAASASTRSQTAKNKPNTTPKPEPQAEPELETQLDFEEQLNALLS